MRYFISVILAALLLSCGNNNRFIVQGSIDNAVGDTLFFSRMDLGGDVVLDSTIVKKNGSFRFKQEALLSPAFFKLSLSSDNYITLLGDSTEHIEVTADKNQFVTGYRVNNSEGSALVKNYSLGVIHLRNSVDSLIKVYSHLSDDQKLMQVDTINKQLAETIAQYKQKTGQKILESPRSFAGYYALFLNLSDGSPIMNVRNKNDQVYFSALATSLNLFYPESPRVRQLYNMVLSAKAEERRARILDIMNNAEASNLPDISIPDRNGNEVSLASLKGKVVLLSFWASWDKASLRENEQLKSIYKKYSDRGFEVYQVGLERSKVLWENAIVKTGLPWINVTELQYTSSEAARLYNIQQIPANYLIDRKGEIIGKNLFGSRLENKLKDIL
ncbi:thioredoxin-like domain-containing protein [Geofilum sp. OHC36d9]|uniref:thioredoxin-like domain-containing protein n=1 Tax=Geofilum sp. OHC36d9 TaxID=3458413 RepID=UPI00403421E7